MTRALSPNGHKFLRGAEACRLKPYLDTAGIPTIGWGNTYYEDGRRVKITDPAITQARADQLYDNILKTYVDGVNAAVKAPITQNQFDALVSFVYNEGVPALNTSTLLKFLNAGKIKEAANEFLKWDISGGKHVAALHSRREREQGLFLSADQTS